MLCNLPRAREIMAKHRLDGLLATHRVNIYYLTDYWGALMRIDRGFTNFAVLPRAENAPAGLVVVLTEMHALTERPTWVPNVVAVGRDPEAGHEETLPELYPTRPGSTLTAQEQAWNRLIAAQRGKLQGTPIEALKRIVGDAGLAKGRIGTDDLRVVKWLNDLGLPGLEAVDATNIFREIRLIKTAAELDLLRRAAVVNGEAAMAATEAAHDGATLDELERLFNRHWAEKGGHGIYLLIGSAGGMRHGAIKRGDPFMIDALGVFSHYHGDFGRTAIVGEPGGDFAKSYRAIRKGWEAARLAAKPGVDIRDLTALAVGVVHREGFPQYHRAVVHSIGLEHTDNPALYGPVRPQGSFVLAENMAVSFDMPHHELGWAHMHLEDTLHITKDGAVPLTELSMDLMVLP
ncbi:MAG: aminopeptidase P family protein [Alphaproteobacteria bacterium]|nr:aminopeptidase P family protein [Alphaproteobacteria bacterium]